MTYLKVRFVRTKERVVEDEENRPVNDFDDEADLVDIFNSKRMDEIDFINFDNIE